MSRYRQFRIAVVAIVLAVFSTSCGIPSNTRNTAGSTLNADETITTVANCFEEVGDPYLSVTIENRNRTDDFLVLQRNFESSEPSEKLFETKVSATTSNDGGILQWTSPNHRVKLVISTTASGDLKGSFTARNARRLGSLTMQNLACNR